MKYSLLGSNDRKDTYALYVDYLDQCEKGKRFLFFPLFVTCILLSDVLQSFLTTDKDDMSEEQSMLLPVLTVQLLAVLLYRRFSVFRKAYSGDGFVL